MQSSLKFFAIFLSVVIELFAQKVQFEGHLFLEGASLNYKEYSLRNVLLDSEESSINDIVGYEIGFAVQKQVANRHIVKIATQYEHLSGETLYTGSLLGSNQGYGSVVSTTYNQLDDAVLLAKWLYLVNNYVNLKAGIGLGSYKWRRELSSIQVEVYSWEYYEVLFGSSFRFSFDSHLSFDSEVFYKKAFSPTMSASNLGVTFDLGNVYQYGLRLYALYKLNQYFSLALGYRYNKQQIHHSNFIAVSGATYYEPDSLDRQHFLKAGIIVNF